MIILIVIFTIIHLSSFIIFGSIYSSAMQEIRSDKRLLKIKNINISKVETRIKKYQQKVVFSKKYSYIFLFLIYAFNIIIVAFSKFSEAIDFVFATILFLVFLLFILFVHWLKGHGTIDDNRRILGRNLPGPWRL